MPIFKGEDGENPNGWIHRVERYFVVNRLSEKDKLDIAVLWLEGEALNVLKGLRRPQGVCSWKGEAV